MTLNGAKATQNDKNPKNKNNVWLSFCCSAIWAIKSEKIYYSTTVYVFPFLKR